MDVDQRSLELHFKTKGKIATSLKIPLNNKDDLALAYTPGVAAVSRKLAEDYREAFDYTIRANTVAVVSDGSAVLGLGNIGPYGALPVMEGKCALFKRFANVDAFPLCLATQETEEIIKTVRLIAPVFGGINLEDISAPRCFEVENSLQDLGIPVFHDDQHGTAIVVLAALKNALMVVGKELKKVQITISGAGAAGIAVAKLLLFAGAKNIILVDSQGIIFPGRDNLNEIKKEVAKLTNLAKKQGDLAEAIKGSDVFIGVSMAGIVSKLMVADMNDRAIVFALANPVPEIMPSEAQDAGAAIVGTGRSDFANQINNVLAFPGIFRGALDARVGQITTEMKLAAAEALTKCVLSPTPGKIIPDPFEVGVAQKVAQAVMKAV